MIRKETYFKIILLILFICIPIANGIAKGTLGLTIQIPEMVGVYSGSFIMGNTRNDLEADEDEQPAYLVKLTYNFEIGQYEVTNKQFLDYINDAKVSSKGYHKGSKVVNLDSWSCEFIYHEGRFILKDKTKENHPVINISWNEAIHYCNWLSEKEGLSKAYNADGMLLDINGNPTEDLGKVAGYRLPTEAEWEYAARGGHESKNDFKYAGSNDIDEVGWYWKNSGEEKSQEEWCFYRILNSTSWTQEVGNKLPNELGLFDMTGNVWEWCQDYYGSDYYKKCPPINPVNFIRSSYRVARGGSWFLYAKSSRVSNRFMFYSFLRDCDIGFRIAKTVIGKKKKTSF